MRRTLSLLLALVLLCLSLSLPTYAAEEEKKVYFTNPGIGTDVGTTVDLSAYSVEFASGFAVPADQLTWSSETLTVSNGKVTPTEKGVFPLTATTATGRAKTVYLVAKEPTDEEYVLFYDDFSDPATLDRYKTVQKSSGAEVSVKDGKLLLEAGANSNYYIRLLLPEYLGDFGDYDISASLAFTKAASSTTWASLMFRVQKDNFPYWQAAVRNVTTADNGTELAERTASDKWNVTHKTAYKPGIPLSQYFTLSASVGGKLAATNINGTDLLFSDSVSYSVGRIGIQAKGVSLSVEHIKVTLQTNGVKVPSYNFCDVRTPASNIILPPTLIVPVESAATLADIQTASPATAILRVNAALQVTDSRGNVLTTLESALKSLEKTVIPAFYVSDSAAVAPLAAYIKQAALTDLFFISADAALLKELRTTVPLSVGVLDARECTVNENSDLATLRATANTSYAKVIWLAGSAANRANTEYLQRLLMTVWCSPAEDTNVSYVKGITAGVNGLVINDRVLAESLMSDFFGKNTMVRTVQILGHRGAMVLEQENSLKSCIRAYELGATMVENDIYLTRDGVIVIMHDDTIDRTTNGTGNVSGFTYAELQKYQIDVNTKVPPEPIPTLEEYFEEFKGKDIQIVIEIKTNASTKISQALAELIKKYDIADQVNVITFSTAHIYQMRKYLPEISVGYLLNGGYIPSETLPEQRLETVMGLTQPLGTTYHPSYGSGALGEKFFRAASYRGMTIYPWTISESYFDTYFMYGTYALTTNYPQISTTYTRQISAPAAEVTPGEDGTEFKIQKMTYDRRVADVTNANMVVVDNSDGLELNYQGGVLTAKGEGSATVLFTLTARTSSGGTYRLYTEPVTVIGQKKAETTSGTDVTTAPDTTGDNTPTTPDDGNTSSSAWWIVGICAAVLALALVVVAVVLTRKKKLQK